LPSAVRASIGLAALVAEQARRIPDRAIELPMLALSTALQASLRAQQRYAALAARGDQVLHRAPAPDEAPPWATFDAPVDADGLDQAARNATDDELHVVPDTAADATPESVNGTAPGKRVSKPRARRPSKFDDAGDEG
jgi:hypothetical protein